MIVGTAVLAAIAVLGYYTYSQRSLVDVSQPPAASSEAGGRGAPAAAGAIDRDAAAGDTKSAKGGNSAGLSSPATSPPGTPPARTAVNPPSAGRQPAESQKAKPAAAAIARTQPINASKAVERRPYRPEACTEGVAALGLCTPETTQRRE